MKYRDFFSKRYMLDYTDNLSWADTYTLLWCLYNNRWRFEYRKHWVFVKKTLWEMDYWKSPRDTMGVSQCKAILSRGEWWADYD